MKLVLCIYIAAMLGVIGIGLYHAPTWICCVLSGCVGWLAVSLVLEHYRRPVLAGGSER